MLTRERKPATTQRSAPRIVQDVLRSAGQPLDARTQAVMGSRFGHDFSRARVHADAQAAESAAAIDAVAYTSGHDVVFGAGQYAPRSETGARVLAHELTHVLQQRSAAPETNASPRLGSPNDALETEAAHSAQFAPAGAISSVPFQLVQRQMITPLAAGGGFGGLLERDRNRAFNATLPPEAAAAIPQKIKVWFNTFIPHKQVDGPPGSACFTGDDRGFSNDIHVSSRTHQEVEFEVSTLKKTIDWKHVGMTHEVNCKTGAVINEDTAPESDLTNGQPIRSGREILIYFQVASSNPLVTTAPAIDAEVLFHVDAAARTCRLTGDHDGFPAYEAYVTADGGAGSTVYTYDPVAAGEGISALFPPMDKTVSGKRIKF